MCAYDVPDSVSEYWHFDNFRVPNIPTFLTQLNLVTKVLIKQLFTPNCPVAQLTEHKTEDLTGPWFELKKFCKTFV